MLNLKWSSCTYSCQSSCHSCCKAFIFCSAWSTCWSESLFRVQFSGNSVETLGYLIIILGQYVLLFMYVQPFQPAPTAANVNALAGWMMNPNPSSSIQPPALVASSMPGPPHQGIVVLLSCILVLQLGQNQHNERSFDKLMRMNICMWSILTF